MRETEVVECNRWVVGGNKSIVEVEIVASRR